MQGLWNFPLLFWLLTLSFCAHPMVQLSRPAGVPLASIISRPEKDDQNNIQDIYRYPTDFTRGIIPKPIHSHNDYWRDVPFYSALSVGAVSVEADVWLSKKNQLLVGHHQNSLISTRDLSLLYIRPIMETLALQNPTPEAHLDWSSFPNGVFDMDPLQTFYLFVDVKTDGHNTWKRVIEEIEPLKQAGYLSWFKPSFDPKTKSTIHMGPITIVGTGGTPYDYFSNATAAFVGRYVFYDAPLDQITAGIDPWTSLDSRTSPVASADLSKVLGKKVISKNGLDSEQLQTLKKHASAAYSRKMVPRFYGLPSFPIETRNSVWNQLAEEGVLLNVDELDDAVGNWNLK